MVKSTHKKEVSIFIADLEPAVKYDRTRAEAQKKPKGYLNRYYPTMKHNEKQFNCTVAKSKQTTEYSDFCVQRSYR